MRRLVGQMIMNRFRFVVRSRGRKARKCKALNVEFLWLYFATALDANITKQKDDVPDHSPASSSLKT